VLCHTTARFVIYYYGVSPNKWPIIMNGISNSLTIIVIFIYLVSFFNNYK
jgi:hypothetical protein